MFHPDVPVWGRGSGVHHRFNALARSRWFIPPVLCPGLDQCLGAEQSWVVCEPLYGDQSYGDVRFAHGLPVHAPICLDPRTSPPNTPALSPRNARAYAAGSGSTSSLEWPRGFDEDFFVPLPPAQHFSVVGRWGALTAYFSIAGGGGLAEDGLGAGGKVSSERKEELCKGFIVDDMGPGRGDSDVLGRGS